MRPLSNKVDTETTGLESGVVCITAETSGRGGGVTSGIVVGVTGTGSGSGGPGVGSTSTVSSPIPSIVGKEGPCCRYAGGADGFTLGC